MNPVDVLRKEHEELEIELSELDFIMSEDVINYPNLVHAFWKVCEFWDAHEKIEEMLFGVMKSEGFEIPIDTIFLEHEYLRNRVKNIGVAINSGSEFEVKKILNKDLREFVDFLRKHASDEDEIMSGIIVDGFSEEGLSEVRRIILKAGK